MGEAEIEKLIAERHLQKVQGGRANGEHLIEKAARTLTTAAGIADDDPDNAYVLAYDAAAMPAPRYWPSRVCDRPPAVATTPSSKPCGPSSAPASTPSPLCDDDDTSSSTPGVQGKPPPRARPSKRSVTPMACSTPRSN